jgi:hypothetical protein
MARRSITRALILRQRTHALAPGEAVDPHSLDYLYLIQQKRRLDLSISAGRLRPRNLLLFPILLPILAVRLLDLAVTNQVVRSLINERDLLAMGRRERPPQ